MTSRETWRRLRLGLSTVLGWRRAGWFIPYRYADTLPAAGESPPYVAIERMFAARQGDFAGVLDRIDAWAAPLQVLADPPSPSATRVGKPPRFDQSWFPTLDACAAYALIRDHGPRRIVEVGSGHSTRFLSRALADGGHDGEIVAVDPAPRADIAHLPHVRLVRETVHRADPGLFAALASGDVLFIDSSHILMPGSDVDLLFNRVLPDLPTGVIVHIHDILLPDDYPPSWAWRNYNEQLAVVALLTTGAYTPMFASHFARTRLAPRLSASIASTLPRHPEGFPTSLWLRKA
ncbi:class I SAM-dependent methyltransferase [Reyranella sp. CPCC 100927]|uniref:class I SAM-dependent methyltransferase n=1 Tax=Reyranella sp. CPCC 100927 TaxID=2599616 RepID=UPI0011B431A5|nr:class I SAM-dependent methyltransferase [Reyranella sp. CPCC 100927]TWT02637.1 class I SAM-dependent methyltransferase [Reyranella sp. CPCC 100927]